MEQVVFNWQAILQVVVITTLMSLSYIVITNKILNRSSTKGTLIFIAYMVFAHIIMNAIFYDLLNKVLLETITELHYSYAIIILEYSFYLVHSLVYGFIVVRTHRDLVWTQCVSASLLAAYLSLNIFTILAASLDMFFLTSLGLEGSFVESLSQCLFYAVLVLICYGVGWILKWIRFDTIFAWIFTRKTLAITTTLILFIIKDFYRNIVRIMLFAGIEVSQTIWYIVFAFTFFIIALLYVLGLFERSHQELSLTQMSAAIQSNTISVLESVQMNLRYLRHDMQNLLTSLQVDVDARVGTHYIDDVIQYIEKKSDFVVTQVEPHPTNKPVYRNVFLIITSAFALFIFSIYIYQYNQWVIVSAFALLMFFILGLGAFSLYTNHKRDMNLRVSVERQKQYLELLENVNDKLMKERDDGINLLSSLNIAIKTGSMKEVQHYLSEKFTSMAQPFQDEIKNSYAFCNVRIPELQNLLINKAKRAKLMRKDIRFEVHHPIQKINMDIHDALRCVGILIDNALESHAGTQTTLTIYTYNNDITIVVSNECTPNMSVHDTLKSSKGAHRGHGLGSYHAITDKYRNVLTRTQIKDGIFTQTLRIEGAL